MAITIQGQTGPQAVSDGIQIPPRMGRGGELVVTEYHGKYYEQAYRGNVYTAASGSTGNVLVGSTQASVQAFTLANPAGSGKNLSLIRLEVTLATAPGTAVVGGYGLAVNTNTVAAAVTGTATTPVSAVVGSNNQPVGKALTAATLPAVPTLFRAFATKFSTSAGTNNGQFLAPFTIDFDGSVILTQGSAISVCQLGGTDTTNAAVVCSMTWEEVLP